MAIDGAGNAVVVFADSSSIRVVYRTARGHLGKVRTLSPRGTVAEAPAVAMAPSGEAVVVFQRDLPSRAPLLAPAVVMAAMRTPGHPFAPATTVSSPSAHQALNPAPLTPSVTMASSGEAIAAWSRADQAQAGDELPHVAIEMSTRPPGGAFGPAQPIDTGDGNDGNQPVVLAGDLRGDTVLGWSNFVLGDSRYQLDASYRRAGGSFSSPQALDPYFGTDLSATVDSSGTAAVAWLTGAAPDLNVSRHALSGDFGSPQRISAPHRGRCACDASVVAFGPDRFMTAFQETGSSLVTQINQAPSGYGLADATASSLSGFGRAHRFARPGYAYFPSLVGSPSGLVLAVWEVNNSQATVTVRAGVFGARRAAQSHRRP